MKKGNVEKKALTDEMATSIINLPLLSELLPYKFPNGSMIEGISIICSCCGKDIGPGDIRAKISVTNPQSIAFEAWALCYKCQLVTPFSACRFRDDGTYISQSESGHGWRQGRYAPEKSSGWLSKLKSWLGRS